MGEIQGAFESLPISWVGKVADHIPNGLLYNTRMTIDVITGGVLLNKPFIKAWGIIEDMAQIHYQWGSERALAEMGQPKAGMHEVSSFDHLSAKVDALYKKIDKLTIDPHAPVAAMAPNCEICGTLGHTLTEYHLLVDTEQANYAHGNPYGQRNPNFPYKTFVPNPGSIAPLGFQGAHVAPKSQTLS
jgi:hypothetical protein